MGLSLLKQLGLNVLRARSGLQRWGPCSLGAFYLYLETRSPWGPGENLRRWGTGCDCQMRVPGANRTMPFALVEKASKDSGLSGDRCVPRKPGDVSDGSSQWRLQVWIYRPGVNLEGHGKPLKDSGEGRCGEGTACQIYKVSM